MPAFKKFPAGGCPTAAKMEVTGGYDLGGVLSGGVDLNLPTPISASAQYPPPPHPRLIFTTHDDVFGLPHHTS